MRRARLVRVGRRRTSEPPGNVSSGNGLGGGRPQGEGVALLLTSNWREWYHFRHQQSCLCSGSQFEDYVDGVLRRFHDDYVNPTPAGTLGDGGCDGLADRGSILYACYGQRPMRQAERELAAKIESDFARGLTSWPQFSTWRFVTNAPIGPLALGAFTELQVANGPSADRPLSMRLWTTETLWDEAVGRLGEDVLNELFPGAPGIENVELQDLLPLLDSLGAASEDEPADFAEILPVPLSKMDFNDLPAGSRLELNQGRLMAPRIDNWYSAGADPGLADSHGERFGAIYRDVRALVEEPAEVMERLYVSVAGANFRMDARRAQAAFAVVAYFFDSCHIFDSPPAESGGPDAVANQGNFG